MREYVRDSAEDTLTGIDDFVRGVLRALSSGTAWRRRIGLGRRRRRIGLGRRRRRIGLDWRRRRIGLGWRRIGLGRQRGASQAQHDQNESDGSRRGVDRALLWN